MTALVVYCHPLPDSFNASVAEQVRKTLTNAWGEPRLIDLYKEGFGAVETPEFLLEKHCKALGAATGLVLVYPTWWGGLPALLSGWFEQVLPWGTSVGEEEAQAMLSHLDYLVAVTTHGSTKLVNTLQGEPGKKFLQRSLHRLCPPRCAFRWLAFYNIDRSSEQQRKAFLRRVDRRLTRLMAIISGTSL